MTKGTVVVVGGTSGLGLEVARHYAGQGREVVITGRDPERSSRVAGGLGANVRGVGFDLVEPGSIAPALAGVAQVDHLVLVAIERDDNRVRAYDIGAALRLSALKLVGYPEVVHALLDQLVEDASIVIFGGRAKDRPYPGSTTVTSVNGAVSSMIRTLAVELAPVRVNALHPGIVGDSPYWSSRPAALEAVLARTPTRRLVTMEDIVSATVFLLENRSVNGIDLYVDSGWLLT